MISLFILLVIMFLVGVFLGWLKKRTPVYDETLTHEKMYMTSIRHSSGKS